MAASRALSRSEWSPGTKWRGPQDGTDQLSPAPANDRSWPVLDRYARKTNVHSRSESSRSGRWWASPTPLYGICISAARARQQPCSDSVGPCLPLNLFESWQALAIHIDATSPVIAVACGDCGTESGEQRLDRTGLNPNLLTLRPLRRTRHSPGDVPLCHWVDAPKKEPRQFFFGDLRKGGGRQEC